jgi:hypothetical protein
MAQVLYYLTQKSLNSAETEIENRSQLAKLELSQNNSLLNNELIEARVSKITSSVALKRDLDLLKVLQLED